MNYEEEFAEWYCSNEVKQHGNLCAEEAAELAWHRQQEKIDELVKQLSQWSI